MVLLFYYLLDANVGMSLASWMGIGCAVVISVLAWLFKTTYDNMKKQIEDLQQRVLTAEERANDLDGSINNEKVRSLEEMRKVDERINATYILVLGKMDDLKKMFYEFRK